LIAEARSEEPAMDLVPELADVVELLRCPACACDLAGAGSTFACRRCGKRYPVVAGRPVLIDEDKSIFNHAEYHPPVIQAATTGLRAWVRRLPSPSVNLSAVRSFATMARLLAQRTNPLVLVVGGGVQGKGMSEIAKVPGIRLINIDPSPGSNAVIYGDAHDLPFADGSVDAVIVQAVLEHVVDPQRCVAEIHRVLTPGGLVYSETPFMQQVHLRGFDFTRFTHLGHRRLFRWFDEVESGVVAGPGTALAWSWRYFLASLSSVPVISSALYSIGRVTGFAFEQVDHVLRQRPGAIDAASCTYFLGSRAETPIDDRAVIAGYRGQRRT
jgi:SAM-dependent methyltransferase